jgi:hypothetical protein
MGVLTGDFIMAMTGMQAGINQASSLYQQTSEPTAELNGLARLAEQIIQTAARVDQIASNLNQVAYGIHGPRPEPVSGTDSAKGQSADTLAARIGLLIEATDRLERAYQSVVR